MAAASSLSSSPSECPSPSPLYSFSTSSSPLASTPSQMPSDIIASSSFSSSSSSSSSVFLDDSGGTRLHEDPYIPKYSHHSHIHCPSDLGSLSNSTSQTDFSPAPTYASRTPSPKLEDGYSSHLAGHTRQPRSYCIREQEYQEKDVEQHDIERETALRSGRGSQRYPEMTAGLFKRTDSARRHSRKISEQILLFGKKITAPVRRSLDDYGISISKSAPRLTSVRLRWVMRGLCCLVILLLVTALLPSSSSLSLWGLLADDPFTGPYFDRDQSLAAGKGWGWKMTDNFWTGSVPPISKKPGPRYSYSGESTSVDSSTLLTADAVTVETIEYPDIPCHLDVAAFATQYNLTPHFTYSRRYVTAKPLPPSPNRPEGFDPYPRQLDEPLVQGWDRMMWGGSAHTAEESCQRLSGRPRTLCLQRLRQDDSFEGQESKKKHDDQDKRAKNATPPKFAARSTSFSPLTSCSSSQNPLRLPTYPVPRTRTQPHNLILGLASDVPRILSFLPELEYSFAWSNLHLVLNLPPDPQTKALRLALKSKGIRATIIHSPEEDYLRRWVELPSLLYDFADPGETKWAMVADDDTFWISITKILAILDKYDPDQPRYIGALTDDWRQSDSGPIAFGGAGLILSMPLLDQLRPHWADCFRGVGPADKRLAECVYAHSHTRLTLEWSLMQTDLHDDIRGLLESGRDMATMHHWTSWHTGFDPLLIARAGVTCGSECLLQRFVAQGGNHTSLRQDAKSSIGAQSIEEDADTTFLLVHGLSLTQYPSPAPDFDKTELTWKVFTNSQFAHAVGPTRQRVREGRPVRSPSSSKDGRSPMSSNWRETWTLEDVRLADDVTGLAIDWDGDGRGSREVYIKRGARNKGYLTSGPQSHLKKPIQRKPAPRSGTPISLPGLAARLWGKASTDDHSVQEDEEDEEQQEDDSVIELVWV